jgi:23S rRNA (cytidine1920-2'-O)/16S rRNA (cytidine1409-2'-O)-methyltransferase
VEGFNARDLTPGDLERIPDVVVADLSFISLRKVLPAVARVAGPDTHALLLVKPQFEVGRERLGSGGVVRDPALHRDAVESVARAAEEAGLRVRAVVPSALPGPNGNREFFLWLVSTGPGTVGAIDEAVAQAVAWDPAADEPGAVAGPPPVPPVVVVRERQQRDQEAEQTDEQKEQQP